MYMYINCECVYVLGCDVTCISDYDLGQKSLRAMIGGSKSSAWLEHSGRGEKCWGARQVMYGSKRNWTLFKVNLTP